MMRQMIAQWLVNLVLFSLVTTLILKILPGKTYTPYIRLFTGFILILLFLDPILSAGNLSENLAIQINRDLFDLETKEMESKLIKLEEERKENYEKIYKEEAQNQILSAGLEKGYPLLKAECEFEDGEVKEVTLVYDKKASAISKKEMKTYIQNFYHVKSDNIYVRVEKPDER